jgi:release factor glutamine methyltransferase
VTLSGSSASTSPYCDDGAALDLSSLARALEAAGCVAAVEEATELIDAAQDDAELRTMRGRRLSGEPLAWVTGKVSFCGLEIMVAPGVYVPRWQSEPLARRAAQLLPEGGVAVDLCTGSGALAALMQATRPAAEVVATEIDTAAVQCARRNGMVVYQGDLDLPLPADLALRVDVMTGVLPYVPSDAMHLLPRDVRHFEPRLALDGGYAGLTLLTRAVQRSPRWLRRGGWLLVEVGDDQISSVTRLMGDTGFEEVTVIEDDDGDPRGLCAQLTEEPC